MANSLSMRLGPGFFLPAAIDSAAYVSSSGSDLAFVGSTVLGAAALLYAAPSSQRTEMALVYLTYKIAQCSFSQRRREWLKNCLPILIDQVAYHSLKWVVHSKAPRLIRAFPMIQLYASVLPVYIFIIRNNSLPTWIPLYFAYKVIHLCTTIPFPDQKTLADKTILGLKNGRDKLAPVISAGAARIAQTSQNFFRGKTFSLAAPFLIPTLIDQAAFHFMKRNVFQWEDDAYKWASLISGVTLLSALLNPPLGIPAIVFYLAYKTAHLCLSRAPDLIFLRDDVFQAVRRLGCAPPMIDQATYQLLKMTMKPEGAFVASTLTGGLGLFLFRDINNASRKPVYIYAAYKAAHYFIVFKSELVSLSRSLTARVNLKFSKAIPISIPISKTHLPSAFLAWASQKAQGLKPKPVLEQLNKIISSKFAKFSPMIIDQVAFQILHMNFDFHPDFAYQISSLVSGAALLCTLLHPSLRAATTLLYLAYKAAQFYYLWQERHLRNDDLAVTIPLGFVSFAMDFAAYQILKTTLKPEAAALVSTLAGISALIPLAGMGHPPTMPVKIFAAYKTVHIFTLFETALVSIDGVMRKSNLNLSQIADAISACIELIKSSKPAFPSLSPIVHKFTIGPIGRHLAKHLSPIAIDQLSYRALKTRVHSLDAYLLSTLFGAASLFFFNRGEFSIPILYIAYKTGQYFKTRHVVMDPILRADRTQNIRVMREQIIFSILHYGVSLQQIENFLRQNNGKNYLIANPAGENHPVTLRGTRAEFCLTIGLNPLNPANFDRLNTTGFIPQENDPPSIVNVLQVAFAAARQDYIPAIQAPPPRNHSVNLLPYLERVQQLCDEEEDGRYICPISHEIMKDPAVASDGFTYEREIILAYFRSPRGNNSPITRGPFPDRLLIPNRHLRSNIADYVQTTTDSCIELVTHCLAINDFPTAKKLIDRIENLAPNHRRLDELRTSFERARSNPRPPPAPSEPPRPKLPLQHQVDLSDNRHAIAFASLYSPEVIRSLKSDGFQGIKTVSRETLHELFEKQNYTSILKLIWTEDNLDLILETLMPYAKKGHVIAMLEMSRTICRQMAAARKFLEHRVHLAWKWYLTGLIWTQLDAACHIIPSSTSKDGPLLLTALYKPTNLIPREECNKIDRNQIHKMICDDLEPNLSDPSPQWLGDAGVNSLTPRETLIRVRYTALFSINRPDAD